MKPTNLVVAAVLVAAACAFGQVSQGGKNAPVAAAAGSGSNPCAPLVPQPPPDSEPVVFGDGSVKVRSKARIANNATPQFYVGDPMHPCSAQTVSIVAPVGLTADGRVQMSAVTPVLTGNPTGVEISVQALVGRDWIDGGVIALQRSGNIWQMTRTQVAKSGMASLSFPASLPDSKTQPEFEISSSAYPRIRIAKVKVTGGAFGNQAAPPVQEIPLSTGCSAIIISSEGQSVPTPNPCAGKIVPPAGRGRVGRFKAGNIEAIDVSKELIAGPTRIDNGGAVINNQKLPVQVK